MKNSLTKLAYGLVLVLVAGYAFFALRAGIPALAEKRRQIHALEQNNAGLAQEIEHKRDRINRLRDSQIEQELEIRQRLKLVRPGEKVFVLDEAEKKK